MVMGGVEDGRVFHAQAGQVSDVEEPAIVELFEADFPEGESIVLASEQMGERGEAGGNAGLAVQAPGEGGQGQR